MPLNRSAGNAELRGNLFDGNGIVRYNQSQYLILEGSQIIHHGRLYQCRIAGNGYSRAAKTDSTHKHISTNNDPPLRSVPTIQFKPSTANPHRKFLAISDIIANYLNLHVCIYFNSKFKKIANIRRNL